MVSLDGAAWRRQARLTPVPGQEERATPKPLTPAPFDEPAPPKPAVPEDEAPEPEPAKAEPPPAAPPKQEPPKAAPPKQEPPKPPPPKRAPPRKPEPEAKPAPAGAPSAATNQVARVAAVVAVVAGLALVGASFLDTQFEVTVWQSTSKIDVALTALAAALAAAGLGAFVSRKPMAYALAAALAALLWGWWSVSFFWEEAGFEIEKVGSVVTLLAVAVTTVAMLQLLPAPRDGALVGRAPLLIVLGGAIVALAAIFVDYTEEGVSFWEADDSGLWLGPLAAAAIAAGAVLVFLRRWSAHAALLLGAFVAGNGLIVVELLFDFDLVAAGYWLMLGSVVVGIAGAVASFVQTRRLSARG